MTEQEKQRLRRLVTDLRPFVEAIAKTVDLPPGEHTGLKLAAYKAVDGIGSFVEAVAAEVSKRK